MIVILDYGMGNLRSVEKAFLAIGAKVSIQTDIKGATKVVIPGVGAFESAMQQLAPVADDIRSFCKEGGPLLGICLGQQLLFDVSEENPGSNSRAEHRGLGLVPGRVKYIKPEPGLKIPHIGWNTVDFKDVSKMAKTLPEAPYVYFVHSLVTVCDNQEDVAGTTTYSEEFASAVESNNVWGTQFHPEKSGELGLEILKQFALC